MTSREAREFRTVELMTLIEAHMRRCLFVTMYELVSRFGEKGFSGYEITKALRNLRELGRAYKTRDHEFGVIYKSWAPPARRE